MKQLLLTTALMMTTALEAAAQTAAAPAEDVRPSGAEAFTPGNAILNTAVLFAVGAREAQQSLRNAFGWPTFQEGLVQGVYFRFDPDGYARFSPSPRLDSDVFEVICRPRTYTCIARKGALAMVLNGDGRVQVAIDQVQATDTFALNDGFSELQIPPRVNGVLEPQMETLLSSGGSLVVRRNNEILEDISLAGFSAALAYLKWVAARQDYAVLPRDWPVPNGIAPDPSQTTNATGWPNNSLRSQPVLQTSQAVPNNEEPSEAASPEIAALRSEVALLRDLLLAQTGGQMRMADAPAFPTSPPQADMAKTGRVLTNDDEILHQLEALRSEMGLAAMQSDDEQSGARSVTAESIGVADLPVSALGTNEGGLGTTSPAAEVRHLHYLTVEMGLESQTALLILQISGALGMPENVEAGHVLGTASSSENVFQRLVALQDDDPSRHEVAAEPTDEYQLLGTYFRSVLDEDQVQP
ncbi:MAG: hypothetical protein AAGF78_07065 [Pseudomonadota bacterium]